MVATAPDVSICHQSNFERGVQSLGLWARGLLADASQRVVAISQPWPVHCIAAALP